MNIQSAINKEVFIPRDERMLVAVEVQRRKRKRMSFLPAAAKGDYSTFICVSGKITPLDFLSLGTLAKHL